VVAGRVAHVPAGRTPDLVRLMIIDEIHLLPESSRGPVLESIVARTIRWQQAEKGRSSACWRFDMVLQQQQQLCPHCS